MGGLKDISNVVRPKRLNKKGSLDGIFTMGFAVELPQTSGFVFSLYGKNVHSKKIKGSILHRFSKNTLSPDSGVAALC